MQGTTAEGTQICGDVQTFLADAEDFSEENLKRAGIVRRFENLEMEKCLR